MSLAIFIDGFHVFFKLYIDNLFLDYPYLLGILSKEVIPISKTTKHCWNPSMPIFSIYYILYRELVKLDGEGTATDLN